MSVIGGSIVLCQANWEQFFVRLRVREVSIFGGGFVQILTENVQDLHISVHFNTIVRCWVVSVNGGSTVVLLGANNTHTDSL